MNTRKKLALIFGTPIAIALVLVTIYYSKVQEKLEPVISPTSPSDKPEPLNKNENDINKINKQFSDTFESCKTDEWCDYEFNFEDIHFQFTLPSNSWPSYSGSLISILYADPSKPDLPIEEKSAPYMHISINTDDKAIDDSYLMEKEKFEINGVPGIKYTYSFKYPPGSDQEYVCNAYKLIHNNYIFRVGGHGTESCLTDKEDEIVKSFRFP